MSSYRQQAPRPQVCRPTPPTPQPRDTFIPLADRYPIPPPPEHGSLQQIIASHPRSNLYVQPRRWKADHLELLEVAIIDEDEEGAVPADRPFADLEPRDGDYEEVLSQFRNLPAADDVHGAQNRMHYLMRLLTRAVLDAEGERSGELVRGDYKLDHALHIFYAGTAMILREQEASYNRHHGYRIPLYPHPSEKTKAEGLALWNIDDRHRLVWAVLGPEEISIARNSMMRRGATEWGVEPYVVGMLIQLAMDAERKEGWKGRDEIEVTVFVADYDEEAESLEDPARESTITVPGPTITSPSDDLPSSSSPPQFQSQQPAPPMKLTRFTTNIHISFLRKFSDPRKLHEGELMVFMKSWPVKEEFAMDIFEAVAEATLSEAAIGEWERGLVRLEQEQSAEDEDGREDEEQGEEEGARGVKRKVELVAGGIEESGREGGGERGHEDEDTPAFL